MEDINSAPLWYSLKQIASNFENKQFYCRFIDHQDNRWYLYEIEKGLFWV